ncbi:MAG: hypothetical protein ACF8XB_15275 [Planctomycetota bacterium JB042]
MKRILAVCLLAVGAVFLSAGVATHSVGTSQTTIWGPPTGGSSSRDLNVDVSLASNVANNVTVEVTFCRDVPTDGSEGPAEVTVTISVGNPYSNAITKVTEIKAKKTAGSTDSPGVVLDWDDSQAGGETTSTWRTTSTEGATLFDREEASWIHFDVSVDPGETATVQLLDGTTVIESWSVTEDDPLAMSGYGTTIEALPDSGSGSITWATSAQ